MNKFLQQSRKIASQLEVLAKLYGHSNYSTIRDEKGTLHVNFENGETFKVPCIPFRKYQEELAIKLYGEGIRRILLERPRRSGKEIESWNMILQGAIEAPGLYMMVYPTNVRARAVLWDGSILYNQTSIKFLEMIPPKLVASLNNQEMKVKLVNGSVIWVVGSDIDPNKLRGTNPRGIVYSEFAFQDPRVFYIMLPALRQNNGWMIGQSTFDGMNHFWQLIQNNQNDPLWYCRVDSIVNLVDDDGNRYITDEMIEEDRRSGMPEYLIQQEYYGVVEINEETKYFAHALKEIYRSERIIPGLVIPNSNVYSAFDIGINDCTAIVLFQLHQIEGRMEAFIIGYIENNNRDLSYYVNEIRRFCAYNNLTFKEHYFPHDGQKRDFNTGKNSIDFMQEMGEYAFIVPRGTSKENSIEAMRRRLYNCKFNKENTSRLIDCLANYSKEFDDKMGTYKNRPVHSWASHGVDAFQTMTLALDGGMIADRVFDTIYIQ